MAVQMRSGQRCTPALSPHRLFQTLGVISFLLRPLQVVGWLDLLSAKARYGMWLEAELPEIVPWEQVFHSRGAAAQQRLARGEAEAADPEVSVGVGGGGEGEGRRFDRESCFKPLPM